MPRRIQMTRRPGGWQTTPKAVACGRRKDGPGPYGNPFRIQHTARRWRSAQLAEVAVLLFEAAYAGDAAFRARVRQELAGKDLACWCPPGAPCHCTVLLTWANE